MLAGARDCLVAETAAPAARICSLRREATGFYRAVHPLLGLLAAIERAAVSEVQPYLRDVQDTLPLVNDEVAAQRDALGTVLEANMAVLSVQQARIGNRQNATTEQLTILATIFLPLTGPPQHGNQGIVQDHRAHGVYRAADHRLHGQPPGQVRQPRALQRLLTSRRPRHAKSGAAQPAKSGHQCPPRASP